LPVVANSTAEETSSCLAVSQSYIVQKRCRIDNSDRFPFTHNILLLCMLRIFLSVLFALHASELRKTPIVTEGAQHTRISTSVNVKIDKQSLIVDNRLRCEVRCSHLICHLARFLTPLSRNRLRCRPTPAFKCPVTNLNPTETQYA
jgi:hypothetical protein